ncbi:type VI secretion system protein TssA [Vibrio parahaemolyticus]|nr:type VI secretion system protein TssA [Vibrio parahaemolyticus]EIA1590605.1 type VI secretion system protein TssA [Vibrio parahaemolyticus]EIA1769716.1 type VI secretion system protein TssA [Vibrio parahaemolyticus]EJG0960633.1 type VI secretion system protein TssA [Vibrio parahaemolyticus]EJS4016952.1 type VI secretion system protein TssA [Vibrio parahaemolyticus]
MELDKYRQYVAEPISPDNPVGERLIDDPLFEFVQEQMMKVGSLSHASVKWDEVERSTVQLLREKTKDIKLLAFLLQCLHHDMTSSRWIVSFEVLGDFISKFWVSSYPAPGERGNLARRKFFSQINQRFLIASKSVDYSHFDEEAKASLQAALANWKKALSDAQLGQDDVTEQLVRSVEQGLKTPTNDLPVQVVRSTEPTSASSKVELPSVDSSSEKAIKETLLKVAGFLAEQEQAMPLSIRLKRFALWGGIVTTPDHNAQGETLLRSMSADRVRDYQAQLPHADLALWRKVEQSLTMAPFWFDGQWMSFQIAQKLGQASWCDAIAQECIAFLERLPSLSQLRFKDGTPFVSDDVTTWLLEYQHTKSSGSSSGGDWNDRRQEALSLAKDGGIAVALAHLDDELARSTEPRDKVYWRLLIADVLHANQLEAMAISQYQTLQTQVLEMNVTDWEPSLMERLQQYHS